MSTIATSHAPNRTWNIALWVVQVLLAGFYAFVGYTKAFGAIPDLTAMMIWPGDYPALTRFVGWAEIAGALGLILPALTRVMPVLTPLAAAGLSLIQVFAIVFHATRGETAMTLPMNLVLLALSLLVLWGRMRKAPIAAR
jgi:uncharacterized membrane protein YphA (DoxX/SURF4 family)